jgi:hypothetical protein
MGEGLGERDVAGSLFPIKGGIGSERKISQRLSYIAQLISPVIETRRNAQNGVRRSEMSLVLS